MFEFLTLTEPVGTSWFRPYPPTSLRQDPLFLSLSSSSRNLFASSCSLLARSCSLAVPLSLLR